MDNEMFATSKINKDDQEKSIKEVSNQVTESGLQGETMNLNKNQNKIERSASLNNGEN